MQNIKYNRYNIYNTYKHIETICCDFWHNVVEFNMKSGYVFEIYKNSHPNSSWKKVRNNQENYDPFSIQRYVSNLFFKSYDMQVSDI